MRVSYRGQRVEWPDGTPKYLPWDAASPFQDRGGFNAGCPHGYAAVARPDGAGGTAWVCRRMDERFMTDPDVAFLEQTWAEVEAQPAVIPALWDDFLSAVGLLPQTMGQAVQAATRAGSRVAASVLLPVVEELIKPLAGSLLPLAIGAVALAWAWGRTRNT